MNLRQVIIFMLLSCCIDAYAQTYQNNKESNAEVAQYIEEKYIEGDDYSRMHLQELYLHLIDPTSALERNLKSQYLGFGIDYLLQISSDAPGFIGMGIDYTYLENARLNTVDLIDGFPFDHSTSTSMGNWTAIYRHYLGANIVGLQPFVEGRLGLSAMWTSTSVTSNEDVDFSEFEFNNFDASVSYSYRAGVHYAVDDALYITSKVGYMSSLSTEYDIRDSNLVGESSSYDFYSRKTSTIDAIRYDLGVTFAF